MFIEDDKLPDDVLRKKYSDDRHALCCLECGLESEFDPSIKGSIGRPLLEHNFEQQLCNFFERHSSQKERKKRKETGYRQMNRSSRAHRNAVHLLDEREAVSQIG
jgi:hypothetical protein